jgi:hypothetical protein
VSQFQVFDERNETTLKARKILRLLLQWETERNERERNEREWKEDEKEMREIKEGR